MNAMNRTVCKALVAVVVGTISLLPLAAAPLGTAFSYQGQLSDGGQAGNGRYDLRFNLFTAATGGTLIAGPVTNANVLVGDGLFTTAVDFGAGVFAGDDYWLEVGVRKNATTNAFTPLAPRQSVMPVAYALHATQAGSLPDGAITG